MSDKRIKILMIGYLPPPYFGPSTTYTALLRSEFPQHFDVTFLDITVARVSAISSASASANCSRWSNS